MFNKIVSVMVVLSFVLTNTVYGMPAQNNKGTLRAISTGAPGAPVSDLVGAFSRTERTSKSFPQPTIEGAIRENMAFAVATRSLKDPQKTMKAMDAAIEGGIKLIEITLTTPGSSAILRYLSKKYANRPDIVIAAGTIRTKEDVDIAVDAGARAIFTPILDEGIIQRAQERGVLIAPGTSSDEEIEKAIAMAVRIIKIFPAFYGDNPEDYLKAVSTPLPELEKRKVVFVTSANEVPEGEEAVTTATQIWRRIQNTKEGDAIYVLPRKEKGLAWISRPHQKYPHSELIPPHSIKYKK